MKKFDSLDREFIKERFSGVERFKRAFIYKVAGVKPSEELDSRFDFFAGIHACILIEKILHKDTSSPDVLEKRSYTGLLRLLKSEIIKKLKEVYHVRRSEGSTNFWKFVSQDNISFGNAVFIELILEEIARRYVGVTPWGEETQYFIHQICSANSKAGSFGLIPLASFIGGVFDVSFSEFEWIYENNPPFRSELLLVSVCSEGGFSSIDEKSAGLLVGKLLYNIDFTFVEINPEEILNRKEEEVAPVLEVVKEEEIEEFPQVAGEGYRYDYEYMNDLLEYVRIKYVQKNQKALEKKEKEIKQKLELARASGFVPRFERLVERYQLTELQRDIFLILLFASHNRSFASEIVKDSSYYFDREITVGRIVKLIAGDDIVKQFVTKLEFLPSSKLVKANLIVVKDEFSSALPRLGERIVIKSFQSSSCFVEEPLYDYLMGARLNVADYFPGIAKFYKPSVDISKVILPPAIKRVCIKAVGDFLKAQARRPSKVKGSLLVPGLTFYFWGPPGTGKTMLAEALATKFGMNMMLVTFSKDADEVEALPTLFREARLKNAVVFLDEFPNLGGSFYRADKIIAILRKLLDVFDGIVIFASNFPLTDGPLRRRINHYFQFDFPSVKERELIWKVHVNEIKAYDPGVEISDDINYTELAEGYNFSGGLIRNVVSEAYRSASARPKKVLKHTDLVAAAEHIKRIETFGTEVVDLKGAPKNLMDLLHVKPEVKDKLLRIIKLARAGNLQRNLDLPSLYYSNKRGIKVLFLGSPGTGKSFAAAVLAKEIGRKLKKVDFSTYFIYKSYTGNLQSEAFVQAVLSTCDPSKDIAFLDDAEGILGARKIGIFDRNLAVAAVMNLLESFTGILIVSVNQVEGIDPALMRRFDFIIKFDPPDKELRKKIWKDHLPSSAKVSDEELELLAEKYVLTGARIRDAIWHAAQEAYIEKMPLDFELLRKHAAAQAAMMTEEEQEGLKTRIGF